MKRNKSPELVFKRSREALVVDGVEAQTGSLALTDSESRVVAPSFEESVVVGGFNAFTPVAFAIPAVDSDASDPEDVPADLHPERVSSASAFVAASGFTDIRAMSDDTLFKMLETAIEEKSVEKFDKIIAFVNQLKEGSKGEEAAKIRDILKYCNGNYVGKNRESKCTPLTMLCWFMSKKTRKEIGEEVYKRLITLIKLIIEAGADVNQPDANGEVALGISVKASKVKSELIELLLKSNASVDILDPERKTPFYHLIRKKEKAAFKLWKTFLQKGADPLKLDLLSLNAEVLFKLLKYAKYNKEQFKKIFLYILSNIELAIGLSSYMQDNQRALSKDKVLCQLLNNLKPALDACSQQAGNVDTLRNFVDIWLNVNFAPQPVIDAAPQPVMEAPPQVMEAPQPVMEDTWLGGYDLVPELYGLSLEWDAAPQPELDAAPQPVIDAAPQPVIDAAPQSTNDTLFKMLKSAIEERKIESFDKVIAFVNELKERSKGEEAAKIRDILNYCSETEKFTSLTMLCCFMSTRDHSDIGGKEIYIKLMKLVELIVEAGADINQRDANREAPLEISVNRSYIKSTLVKLLLKLNANVDILNTEGKTPLCYLIKKGKVTCLRLCLNLLQEGADPFKLCGELSSVEPRDLVELLKFAKRYQEQLQKLFSFILDSRVDLEYQIRLFEIIKKDEVLSQKLFSYIQEKSHMEEISQGQILSSSAPCIAPDLLIAPHAVSFDSQSAMVAAPQQTTDVLRPAPIVPAREPSETYDVEPPTQRRRKEGFEPDI